ncbi:MAG: 3-phosphoglycerate dehydrogenase, partial [Kiritimatiellae bacterium]|nr:3-phosphoglycerate dehydrogenase [Kiritimatiellia bacterium]
RNVARIAKGFGMKVSALDPFVADEVMEADGIQPVHSVEQLYADNQIVSLHIPANDQTRRSVTERLLTSMPKGAILVNAARKEVIDEPGLQAAMAARSDLRYIADVKPDIADELQQLYPARVLFTPKKMGAQTAEANINAGLAAARQIVDHLATGWNRFQVNK